MVRATDHRVQGVPRCSIQTRPARIQRHISSNIRRSSRSKCRPLLSSMGGPERRPRSQKAAVSRPQPANTSRKILPRGSGARPGGLRAAARAARAAGSCSERRRPAGRTRRRGAAAAEFAGRRPRTGARGTADSGRRGAATVKASGSASAAVRRAARQGPTSEALGGVPGRAGTGRGAAGRQCGPTAARSGVGRCRTVPGPRTVCPGSSSPASANRESASDGLRSVST